MKKTFLSFLLIIPFFLIGCNGSSSKVSNIDVNELSEMLKEDYQFVDVRTLQEYNDYHIDEFNINIDYYKFKKDLSLLDNLDKSKPIVLICRSGNRSSSAASLFINEGFEKVFNVTGGMNAWSNT